jgi:hypothetical protein
MGATPVEAVEAMSGDDDFNAPEDGGDAAAMGSAAVRLVWRLGYWWLATGAIVALGHVALWATTGSVHLRTAADVRAMVARSLLVTPMQIAFYASVLALFATWFLVVGSYVPRWLRSFISATKVLVAVGRYDGPVKWRLVAAGAGLTVLLVELFTVDIIGWIGPGALASTLGEPLASSTPIAVLDFTTRLLFFGLPTFVVAMVLGSRLAHARSKGVEA